MVVDQRLSKMGAIQKRSGLSNVIIYRYWTQPQSTYRFTILGTSTS
jgi:hypothetical protein